MQCLDIMIACNVISYVVLKAARITRIGVSSSPSTNTLVAVGRPVSLTVIAQSWRLPLLSQNSFTKLPYLSTSQDCLALNELNRFYGVCDNISRQLMQVPSLFQLFVILGQVGTPLLSCFSHCALYHCVLNDVSK